MVFGNLKKWFCEKFVYPRVRKRWQKELKCEYYGKTCDDDCHRYFECIDDKKIRGLDLNC